MDQAVSADDHLHEINDYIGARIRDRRKQLRLSQGDLGTQIGLTYQQVQKYEQGTNKVSAERLPWLARALDVPITYFFQPHQADRAQECATGDDEVTEGMAALARMRASAVRSSIVALLKTLCAQEG